MKKIDIAMKNIKRITFSLILCAQVMMLSAQGWGLSFLITGSSPARNDVIHMPNFNDTITLPIGLYSDNIDQLRFNFSRIIADIPGAGFSSGPFLPDSLGEGNFIPITSLLPHPDTTFVLVEYTPSNNNKKSVLLFKLHADNNSLSFPNKITLAERILEHPDYNANGHSLQATIDDNMIFLGAIQSEVYMDSILNDLVVSKYDLAGNIIWSNTYSSPGNDIGVQLLADGDGGFWILKNTQPDPTVNQYETRLINIDENGNILLETTIGQVNDVAKDMLITHDDQLAVMGSNGNDELYVSKFTTEGLEIWRQDYASQIYQMHGRGLLQDNQQHLLVAGNRNEIGSSDSYALLAKLSPNGVPLWERQFGKPNLQSGFNDIILTPEGQYLMGGFTQNETSSSETKLGYFIKTDTFGIVKGGIVKGNVFYDTNLSCIFDSPEINLENWKIEVSNDTLNFYGNTDADGNYWIPVDVASGNTVDYIVTIIPPSTYWEACNNEIPITISYLDTVEVEFPMQALVECPFPEVQISNSNIRPCEPATLYIQYTNLGTTTAEDATVELTLDDYLSFSSASIPPTNIDQQVISFDLGDVGVNENIHFSIEVFVDCDSVAIGNTVCIEASITPDSLCDVGDTQWSGALLQLDYECIDNEILFNIENIGTADMATAQEYIIIEDAVLLMQGNFDLEPNEKEPIMSLPIDGSIYHIIAPQEPGAPGAEWISLGADGCPNSNSEAFNMFPQNSGNTFTVIHCPIVVGSFDPNDKQAIPSGFGEEHYILPNTDIKYTIRFQNTGTDTAFRVVILDTLANELDPATISPGPSSHPYTWRLEENGTLRFSFNPIALPDSTTNLDDSQGFVSFSISQKPDLTDGTRIENTAGIYFDFNAPIYTNTTFHTVSDLIDIVESSVSTYDPGLSVNVIPNPMQDGAWITLNQVKSNVASVSLQLYNSNGQHIRTVQGEDTAKVWLDRAGLQAGMYFFTIHQDNKWLANGKLVIQ